MATAASKLLQNLQHTIRAGRTAAGAFKKSEIPCRIGKASFVLRAWIGNSWGATVMSQRAGTAEAEIKALIEAWADAVRRHDLPAILARHADDIVMFDVPPPLQSRGMAAYKKTWDLFFAYHQPGQALDVEELQMCVGDTVAWCIRHEHHSVPATG
jgi:ketosteroid isomerase-like protein